MTHLTKLEYTRGDNIDLALTFKDGDGNVINITSWTIFFTAKENVTDTDAQAKISKTVTSHTNAAQGQTEIHIPSTDTSPLNGVYRFDIQAKTNSGEIKTVLNGVLNIQEDITLRTS